MKKIIGIIAGEPNSISSEIIFKCWKYGRKNKLNNFIIIGSIKLLIKQKKKLHENVPIYELKQSFKPKDIKKNKLCVLNVKFNQKKPFDRITIKSNKYIFNCFSLAIDLIRKKRISAIINCPISKETLFKGNSYGVTEYFSKKLNEKDNEVMLIFNKNLSVSPLTTHIPLKNVSKKIHEADIIKKVKTIHDFYIKKIKIKPKIAVLGLNPHAQGPKDFSEEKKIIKPAISRLKKMNINAFGPVSPDTIFTNYKSKKINIVFGMYHDQVLTGLKTLFKFKAINVTLGLKFIRVSPDHGVATDITGKKLASAESLIESVKFCNYIK